jgi:hypothetical protein
MARIEIVIEGDTADALVREMYVSGWTMQQVVSRILLDGVEAAYNGLLAGDDERRVELPDVAIK